MKRLVVDIEANNLYDKVTKVHCIVAKDIDSGEIFQCFEDKSIKWNGVNNTLDFALDILQQADQIIGHNFVGYDMRVLDKLYGLKLDVNKIVDTMLLSYMLNPHRRKHPECPPSRLVGDKRVPIGAHSLQNWGYVVGRGKIENEQWDIFTENMLYRCQEDVLITELVAKNMGIINV